ncbi:cupin domain-containing protein [Halorussus gelatinilyticus]|uniref:Cupin domain-containing protein n=1 Tax=Halorussus gelatinilyticus TaxID=2937524 RepID=A0A8U0IKQ3_9EURY|nr:cupin domain-containing protein [Halorussus gelatinilyticus]UPW01256.1 cupin domain-containing protein [Halorussus gelatinilyticus]
MEVVPKDAEESTEAVDGVHLSLLAGADEMNVQHFFIEPDAEVPEHSHPNEQTGFITNGTLTFLVDGEEIDVSEGDSYAIPGDEPHAAENRGDVPVEGVDIFSPPRENPDWKD